MCLPSRRQVEIERQRELERQRERSRIPAPEIFRVPEREEQEVEREEQEVELVAA